MLLSLISFGLASAIMAFGYRWLRNGCFDRYLLPWIAGDTFSRSTWGWTYLLGWSLLVSDVRLSVLATLFITQQLSIRVPHGYFMDLGEWKAFQAKWPSYVLPTFTQEQWEAMSESQRAAWDAMQGACAGLVRGVISFVPLMLLGYGAPPVLAATAIVSAGTPVAYYLARFIPWDFAGVHARTIEWGEVLHGPLWALAFYMMAL